MNSVGGAVQAELGEMLKGIRQSGGGSPVFTMKRNVSPETDTARKGWQKSDKARCDFSTTPCIVHAQTFYIHCRWKHTRVGRTLTEIKADESMVQTLATEVAGLIRQTLGTSLREGGYAVVAPPPRRHKARNFATMIAEEIARELEIDFHKGTCEARTRQRVDMEYDLIYLPTERNLIVFDDFTTTGSTLTSMHNLFKQKGKNLTFFTAINNKT